jgi:hypothetical protein
MPSVLSDWADAGAVEKAARLKQSRELRCLPVSLQEGIKGRTISFQIRGGRPTLCGAVQQPFVPAVPAVPVVPGRTVPLVPIALLFAAAVAPHGAELPPTIER